MLGVTVMYSHRLNPWGHGICDGIYYKITTKIYVKGEKMFLLASYTENAVFKERLPLNLNKPTYLIL